LKGEKEMGDVDRFIEKQKKADPKFAEGFDEGYVQFKIGVLLKTAREQAGFTQDQIAQKLKTNKSAISRIENHSEDIRLSTLSKYAKALGKKVKLEIA
jgi:DNA-binding XRE family transcriptional regulator